MIDDDHGQHAGHAGPLRSLGCKPIDLVVGHRDRFSNTIGSGARLAFKSRPKNGQGNIGRFSTRCLAANTIDNDEKTAGRVTMESILVNRPLATRIRLPSSYKCVDCSHFLN